MRFRYVAYLQGTGVVKGRVEAPGMADARLEVSRQGLRPIRVAPERRLPALESMFPSLFKVTQGEMSRTLGQLATMLASGAGLLRALELLEAESGNRVLKSTLASIRRRLDQGDSLSAAMARFPEVFGHLLVKVVEVGEHTGRLAAALEETASALETEREARQKAVRTLMYPVAIMGLSMVTLTALMVVAMPQLLKVFVQFNAEVPLMTRMAVSGFTWLKDHALYVLLGLALAAAALGLARRLPAARYVMDAALLKAPVLGPLVVGSELARFSRTLAMMLESGVPLASALQLGAGGSANQAIRRGFAEAEESLMSGHGLTEALRKRAAFPRMFVELLMVGEQSNSLPRAMGDLAETYQKEVEQRLNALLGLLEPASTLFVGTMVGFIAFSMFVPIYSGLNAIP